MREWLGVSYVPHQLIIFISNVDRLFAMWQAVYPDSYVNATAVNGNSYTTQSGTILDQYSRMTCFLLQRMSSANAKQLSLRFITTPKAPFGPAQAFVT